MHQTSGHTRPGSSWIAAGVIVAAFYLAAVPLILSGRMPGRAGFDQLNYHEPTIRQFAAEWPRPDLRDYLSATTPGYHLVLAVAATAGLDSPAALQLFGSLFTAALLGVLAASCAARLGAVPGIAVALPVACSMYVFMPGVWLLPDNAGWLGVLLVLLLALRTRFDALTVAGGGALLAALVMVRQVHLWAAAPLCVSAWLGPGAPGHRLRTLFEPAPARLRRAALMLAATLPALVIIGLFFRMWGGLTPPRFHQQYRGINPAAPAFILALLGGFSVFFVGFFRHAALRALREDRLALSLSACAGAALALLPRTTLDVHEGRFSGLWNFAGRLPVVAGRTSPLIVLLSALGAVTAVVWARVLPPRDRWILFTALPAFCAAQMASFEIFQRYSEPLILMLLAVMAGRAVPAPAPAMEPPRALVRLVPVGVLALLLGVLTAWKTSTDPEAHVTDALPGRADAAAAPPG